MIKVMITDDHPIVVEGMKQFINEQHDMTVVGIAINGQECKDNLKKAEPDILLLDINLPDESGLDICVWIKKNHPSVRIIGLTGFKEYSYIDEMMRRGAIGYVLKNSLPNDILDAIRSVYLGKYWLSEEVKTILISHKPGGKRFLTNREKELLKLIVEGYTNRQIADKLFLSVETINSYRKNLLLKLGVKNTASMVKLALTENLLN
jgi:DNA-binding NarL/FixJ family response regulator